MYTTKSKFSHKTEGTVARCGSKKYHMPTVDSGKYIHLQNNKSRIQSETQLELQHHVCSIRVDMGGM